MSWLFLTILSIISRAVYGLSTKVLTNRIHVSAITQSFLLLITVTILSMIITPFFGGISFIGLENHIVAIAIMIICTFLGNLTYFIGQQKLDSASTQISFSSILLWGMLLSIIFLGSSFSFKQGIGVIILFAAIILIQDFKSKRKINTGVAWVILSAVFFAGFQVANAHLSKIVTPATATLLAYGGPAILFLLFFFPTLRKDFRKIKLSSSPILHSLLFAGGTSTGYFVFSYLAYRTAPDPGIVVILLTVQVVLSVILSIIFLQERDNLKRKLLAGILAFIASLLIKS